MKTLFLPAATKDARKRTAIFLNLIYSANGADVVLTMCDGKVLYEDGDFKTIDVERAAAECDTAVDEILSALKADAEQAK